MRKRISRFAVHQTSKVIGLWTFLLAALIAFPYGAYLLVNGDHKGKVAILFMLPFIYWLMSYLSTAFFLWAYNVVARGFGGIEFVLVDREADEAALTTESKFREEA